MNEFVIISKDVFEEMVGKFSHFSDRVNEILNKRDEGSVQSLDGQSGSLSAITHQSPYLADASRQRHTGLLPNWT